MKRTLLSTIDAELVVFFYNGVRFKVFLFIFQYDLFALTSKKSSIKLIYFFYTASNHDSIITVINQKALKSTRKYLTDFLDTFDTRINPLLRYLLAVVLCT